MYDKIKKTEYNILQHFSKKIDLDISNNFNPVHLKNNLESKETEIIRSKIYKDKYSYFKYKDMLQINQIHSEYIKSLKSNLNFTALLYKAELTGAKVKFRHLNLVKEGIIVEERENTLLVVHENDKLKVYVKKLVDIVYEFEGKRYFFVGKWLKSNRFFKK